MSRVIDAVIRLTDKFTSPMSKTIKAMTEASSQGKRMRKEIDAAGKSISAVGASLTKAVTMPVIGVGVACGKMAMDFEDGIAKVSTIADTSVMSLDSIKSATIDLSNQLGVSVAEISEAQYNAISAGAATEASLGLVATAVKAAKAGFTDTATAVDGLTTVYNSFMGAVDYQTIADQMLVTQNYGKTTFGEMASSIGMVTPVANSLNVSTQELFSSIAILTKNGINTSSAITGLKAAYSNILKPTADASKTAKQLGIDFSAAHLQSVGWAQFLAEIKEKTGGSSDAMAKLFGSVEALNSMTVLAGAGMDDFNACLEQMSASAGTAQAAYEKMITPSERWSMALNKIKNAGITVGEKLLPVFERVTDVATRAADRFNGLSDSQIEMAMKIAGAAAAVGPLVSVFGKLVSGSAGVLGAFAKVSKAGGIIKFALAALTSPAGIVIGVFAAIVAAAILVYKNFDKIKASVQGFAQKCQPQIELLKGAFENVKGAVASVAPRFGELAQKASVMAQTVWTAISPLVDLVKSVFVAEIRVAFAAAAGYIRGFSTQIKPILNGVMSILDGIITFVTGVFSANWQMAWEGVRDIFSGSFQAIVGIAKGAVNGVAGAINSVIGAINGMGFTIPDWVPGVGGKAFSINIPTIPMLARGTDNWKGGIAQVSEKGGEIIDLPRGSRVYPHDESIRRAKEEGSRSFVLEKLADQIIVREDADIDRIAQALFRRLSRAGMNMGGAY